MGRGARSTAFWSRPSLTLGSTHLREAVDVPVVGIGESGLGAAAQLGSYAILTVARGSLALVDELVARHDVDRIMQGRVRRRRVRPRCRFS
jgi:Asp/Glu/hydantoin racemase